jgi:hypothetical protein
MRANELPDDCTFQPRINESSRVATRAPERSREEAIEDVLADMERDVARLPETRWPFVAARGPIDPVCLAGWVWVSERVVGHVRACEGVREDDRKIT